MPGWLVFLIILFIIFLVFMFNAGYRIFMLLSYNAGDAKKTQEHLPGQDVFLKSGDDLQLHGRYIPAEEETRRIILCVHGCRSTPEEDFGDVIRWLHKDCDLLLVDQRACGNSGGTYITFGAKEKADAARWAALLIGKNQRNLPIYLYGVEMGAATVLLTAGSIFPESVKGIIADGSYASLKEILKYQVSRKLRIPAGLLTPFFAFWCREKGGFSMDEADVVHVMGGARLPVLFFCGTDDQTVPMEQTRACYHACTSDKELVPIENAGHGRTYSTNPERYEKHVRIFFERFDTDGF